MPQVDIVKLRDVERLTWDRIGSLIGKDEKTARRWYRKAKTKPSGALAAIRRLIAKQHA